MNGWEGGGRITGGSRKLGWGDEVLVILIVAVVLQRAT